MADKFILLGIDDKRSKDIAEVIGNPTCKKILNFLADEKEASVTDISNALNVPLNTIDYNIKKLVNTGLVEKVKNFFWSTKGRKIEVYKIAKKHIIISPKMSKPSPAALRAILPVFAILIIAAIIAAFFMFKPSVSDNNNPTSELLQLNKFKSMDELKQFLNTSSSMNNNNYYGGAEKMMAQGAAPNAAMAATASDSGTRSSAQDYSTTNIQVQGVDEPDFMKNDGKYIYTISGSSLVIVEAYPVENMKVVAQMNFTNQSINNIFINQDKLIVFGQGTVQIPALEICPMQKEMYYNYNPNCYPTQEYKSIISVYDISDRANPTLEQDIAIEGNYYDARMIGDYVYVLSNKYINSYDNPVMPYYAVSGVKTTMPVTDLYYFDNADNSYVFTSVTSINLKETAENVNNQVFLTGYTGTVYVSENNIYLTAQKTMSYETRLTKMVEDVYLQILPSEEASKVNDIMASSNSIYEKSNKISQLVYGYSASLKGAEKSDFDTRLQNSLMAFEETIQKELQKTVIHKINVDNGDINYLGSGEVPGTLLNQFSLDEYKNNLRVATTTGNNWNSGQSFNNLYILNKDLEITGKVEDLAAGERIYSTRFLGDRAYMVTFKTVDPLFVIDVSDSSNPQVLGYLKIPGYSDYLHPYDENHVIGIGKDVNESIDAEKVHSSGAVYYTAILGVKVSLFDVSDVSNPIEQAKLVIGDRGTQTDVTSDHKAFLFDKEKGIIVMPVQLYEINKSKYPEGNIPTDAQSDFVWQGALVLNIDENGITERGRITHTNETKSQQPNRYYYYDYSTQIQRSLFMDNYLYTVSQSKIKANNLETIDEISTVDLGYKQEYYSGPILY